MTSHPNPTHDAEFLKVISRIYASMEPIPDRDFVYSLELDFNPDAQLIAIRGLIAQNRDADDRLAGAIRASEEHVRTLTGRRQEVAIEQSIGLMQDSVYQNAAHSMSAVGMIAPFIETVLAQCLEAVGRRFFTPASPPSEHDRWKSTGDKVWDCHWVFTDNQFEDNPNLLRGTEQISNEIGLHKYLTPDNWKTLEAIYGYRNKMLHNGFEWPQIQRKRFAGRWAKEWPATWFSKATTDDNPWIFYMTDEFIEHCLNTAEEILVAFGRLIRNDLAPRLYRKSDNTSGETEPAI